MWRNIIFVVLVAFIAACGAYVKPSYFQPTERVLGATAEGEKVAIYDLVTSHGYSGEVKLSSRGVDQGIVDGEAVTLVHVGVAIENTGVLPVALDPSALLLTVGGRPAELMTPGQPLVVQPGNDANADLFFRLPDQLTSATLRSFEVRWAVTVDTEPYRQSTRFTPDPGLNVGPPSGSKPAATPWKLRRHQQVVIAQGRVKSF